MHKATLFKALSDPQSVFVRQVPPEGAAFFHDEEVKACCSILDQLITQSLSAPVVTGNRHALPLPDIDLPLVF